MMYHPPSIQKFKLPYSLATRWAQAAQALSQKETRLATGKNLGKDKVARPWGIVVLSHAPTLWRAWL